MRRRRFLLIVALVLLAPAALRAQSCTYDKEGSCTVSIAQPNTTTVTIGSLVTVSMTLSTTSLSFSPTSSDLDAGMTPSTGVTATISGNHAWTFSVRGSGATWTSPAGAPRAKPIGDLHWATTTGATGTSVTTSDVQVASGSAGAATPTIYFRTVVVWNPNAVTGVGMSYPGSYSTTLTFTLTAP